jgi:alkylation response protein AidB-like acyl-CoA dehydrogenase
MSLFLVDMKADGVEAKSLTNIDPSRGQAELTFKNCKAEPLGAANDGWSIISQVLDRAAVLMAFEQVGGADRALEMGRDYALDRIAFGRPIGSFQAVKHMLADMYVSATLARSNCYYGAWALSTGASELPEAAASARISATQAAVPTRRSRAPRRSSIAPRTTSRFTAAWVSPGSSIATCTTAAPTRLRWGSAACLIGKTR